MVGRALELRGIGLALACVMAAVSCTSEAGPTTSTSTTAAATGATTGSTTTTSIPKTTSTTSPEQRIAEVTEIIRQVDFTFFTAIFLKDEQMLADALAVRDRYANGLELMEDDDYFTQSPTREALIIEVKEILIDREDCLAVSYHGDATAFRGPRAQGDMITVYWPRPTDGEWRRAYRGDEWREACDVFTREGQLS